MGFEPEYIQDPALPSITLSTAPERQQPQKRRRQPEDCAGMARDPACRDNSIEEHWRITF